MDLDHPADVDDVSAELSGFNLQINISTKKYPTAAEVSAALARFRDRCESNNREVFSTFVRLAEEAIVSNKTTAEEALYSLHDVLGYSPERATDETRIDSLSDLERNWPALVRRYKLDGVVIRNDAEQRERNRVEFREAVLQAINKGKDDGDKLDFPEDVYHLMGQVDELIGHGWPGWRVYEDWLHPFEGLGGNVAERITRSVEEIDYSKFDYKVQIGQKWLQREVRAGWRCGSGAHMDCYVLYCRAANEKAREKDTDGEWRWRWLIDGKVYGVYFFDDTVEMLEWYGGEYVPDFLDLDVPQSVLPDSYLAAVSDQAIC